MITVKSKDFRQKVGKFFDVFVGEQELVSGIYLSVQPSTNCKIEKHSDKVVIVFIANPPKLKLTMSIINIAFTEVEKITIYKDRAIIKLDTFPDIQIVEE